MEMSYETDSSKGTWSVLSPSVLKNLKLQKKDVLDVKLAYYALSNYPYEEQNVARCSHPCEGSIGFYIYTDSCRYLVEEIFYYDYNLDRNHYYRSPHWNHERRLNDGNQTRYQESKQVEFHTVTDSPSITLKVSDKGTILYEKTVNCVPIDQVRKQK